MNVLLDTNLLTGTALPASARYPTASGAIAVLRLRGAAMSVHGLTHVFTFNTTDFARYPGVTALDPSMVASPPGLIIPPRHP